MKACFDQDGFLIWLSRHNRDEQPDDNHIVVDVPDTADANDLFYNGSEVVTRSDLPLSPDKAIIVADNADTATIAGLPDPCWVRVNGRTVKVTGGSFAVKSSEPASLVFEAIGAHRSEPVFIQSNTAQALMDEVRVQRDVLLLASDWTQGRDCKMDPDKQAAWADYRALLRDLPEQQPNANINSVVWPAKPS